jgi:hypothetical protein
MTHAKPERFIASAILPEALLLLSKFLYIIDTTHADPDDITKGGREN